MKNLSKEQISVIAASVLSILLLAYQVLTIDASANIGDHLNKYRASLDSVRSATEIIEKFKEPGAEFKKDVFNFKIIQKKKVVEEKQEEKAAVEYKWVNTNDLELYTKDVIVFSLFFSGKARFTINGKTQEVKVGDKLAIGNIIQKQVIAGTNEATGNTRVGSEYKGSVLSVNERSVYVDTADKNRVVQYKLNADARYFQRNLMQDPSAEDKESPDVPQSGGDTPGRRVPRPGGR